MVQLDDTYNPDRETGDHYSNVISGDIFTDDDDEQMSNFSDSDDDSQPSFIYKSDSRGTDSGRFISLITREEV